MRYRVTMNRPFLLLLFLAACALGQTPTITQILNNYGLEPLSNSQNSGIAQGSIFIVKGSNLSDQTTGLQSAPLSSTLQGVRMRIVVNGTTTYAPLYYVLPAQLAGILPSNTPAGSGLLYVENNGRTSSPSAIKVVKSAFGTLTLNGTATGMAAVHDQNYVLLSNTNATNPGQYLVFYGSGIGPTTKDEAVAQTGANASGDLTSIPVTVTIGGKNATVLYRGRTQFPGLDQINVQVPTLDAGSYSCGVLVYISVGSVYSNVTRIPVAASGKTCTNPPLDPSNFPGLSQSDIERLLSGNVKFGALYLIHSVVSTPSFTGGPPTVTTTATATSLFESINGPDLRYYFTEANTAGIPLVSTPTAGTCSVLQSSSSSTSISLPPSIYYDITYKYLDAGASLSIKGPAGTLTLPRIVAGSTIEYTASTDNTNLQTGSYTLSGTGGPDIAAFSKTFDMSVPLVWTNRDSLVTVTRANGMKITWSGGDSNQFVYIFGYSTSVDPTTFASTAVGFQCYANQKDGSFTVPASILNLLPASTSISGFAIPGFVSIGNSGNSVRLDVPGVDYFYVGASSGESQSVTFQ